MNYTSLTIRIPLDLYKRLDIISNEVGFTKSTFIRIAIFTYLYENNLNLEFNKTYDSNKHRMVLNVNETAYNLLTHASNEYKQPINTVIVSLIDKYLDFFSKVLPELNI